MQSIHISTSELKENGLQSPGVKISEPLKWGATSADLACWAHITGFCRWIFFLLFLLVLAFKCSHIACIQVTREFVFSVWSHLWVHRGQELPQKYVKPLEVAGTSDRGLEIIILSKMSNAKGKTARSPWKQSYCLLQYHRGCKSPWNFLCASITALH